jgi:hypothetical protein
VGREALRTVAPDAELRALDPAGDLLTAFEDVRA